MRPAMKLLYPTSSPLDLEDVDEVVMCPYDPRQPIPDEHADAEVLVVWGNPRAQLERAARSLTQLRWVQTLAAGPDAVLGAGFDASVVVTSGRGLQDRPVAEHALALILAAARRLHELRDAQREGRWAEHLGGIQRLPDPTAFRTLIGARVLIWGLGHIGQRLAAYLQAMGATVTGVATSRGARNGVPVIADDELAGALPDTDVLVMILPLTDATRGILGRERIALLPRHAWVVNVGRGGTVDQPALIQALEHRRIGGAALDVFVEEPLPPSSPLWRLDDVIITPHAAGGRPMNAGQLIMRNLRAFLAGDDMENVVER